MEDAAVPFEDLQWLGGFARRLARDADEADDLVQETLMTAWQSEPDPAGGLRPWLASVMRNRFRMRRRGQARRETREALHAPTPAQADAPDAAVARIRVLEQLAAELAKLKPEDQQLIVRRFLEGQSAAEIAGALSIPAGTVRSRISRLLERLRARLDQRCDGRDAWCAAVLAAPLVGPQGPSTASAQGTSTMIKATLLTLTTVAVGASAWALGDPSPSENASAEPSAAQAGADAEPAAQAKAVTPDTETDEVRWRRTRDRLAEALEATTPASAPSSKTDTRSAYARMIVACVRDIDDQPAQFSVKLTEIGAPDIGTIVSEAEVLGTSVDNPEVVECAEQSMYGVIGDPPAEPFERTLRFGMRMPAKNEEPEHDGKVFRYNMTKRPGELHTCVPEGTRGFVDLDVELVAGEAAPASVKVVETDVDPAVGRCIRDTVLGWRHFVAPRSETRRHRYVLPLQEDDAIIRLHFHMDRHFAQVRACESADIDGYVELDVEIGEGGEVATVELADSTVEPGVGRCIREAAKSWSFPERLAGVRSRHRYVLPVQDLKIAP